MDLSENRICICWSKGIRVQSLEVELADGEPTKVATPTPQEHPSQPIRMSYSVAEAAQLLGVHYFSVYRLIQRGKSQGPSGNLDRDSPYSVCSLSCS